MIIFYQKNTGEIIGTIDGRIHSEDHLNMWIGDKNETERLIFDWTPDKDKNFNPNTVDTEQDKILRELDKKSSEAYRYKVKSGKLIKK